MEYNFNLNISFFQFEIFFVCCFINLLVMDVWVKDVIFRFEQYILYFFFILDIRLMILDFVYFYFIQVYGLRDFFNLGFNFL